MKDLTLSFKNIYLIEKALQDALWEKEHQLKQMESEPLKKFLTEDIARNKEALDAFQAANAQNNYIL